MYISRCRPIEVQTPSFSSIREEDVPLESSSFPHINDTPDTVALLHIRKGLVDAVQRLSVRDELVDLQFPGHIVVDEVGQLGPALDAAEGATFPYAAGDELER